MKRYLFFAVFFMSCVFTINAQRKSELQIGLAMPQGDFADDDYDDAIYEGSGVAGTGIYLGYKLLSPVNTTGLFWTLNAGFMYNSLQSDFRDDIEEIYEEEFEDAELIFPKYINVPLLVGLQYEKSLDAGLSLYGEAALGVNILKLTKQSESYESDYEDGEWTTTFKPSMNLGFKIGGGIVLNDKYTFSMSYLNLGSHKVKYDWDVKYDGNTERGDDKFDKPLPISSLNFAFGIRF